MRKLSLALILAVFTAALFVSTSPASAATSPSSHVSLVRCPRGTHWVKPYRNVKGRWIKGYCKKNH